MSLKQQTVAGIGWSGMGNVVRQALQLVTLLVMARYLPPQEFGRFAILGVFVNFAALLANMGTAQVIVHLDNPDRRLLSSLYYLNLGLGAALCAILFLLAWPIAWFYADPALIGLLQALSASFVLASIGNVQRALMEKAMLFRRIVLVESAALAASCALGVGLAAAGFGAASLVAMSLANAAALSLGLLVTSQWRPQWVFAARDIRKVWAFTSHATAFDIVNFLARNADAALLGKFAGPAALGLYSLAYRVMLYPVENISRVAVRVLFPAFSQLKHDNERFATAYLQAIRLIAMLAFPAMAGLAATANHVVAVAFDPQWAGLALLIVILAPVGMVQSVTATVGTIYYAKGTTGLLLKLGTLNSSVVVLAFAAGIPFGVNGVALFYALATLALIYPTLRISWSQIGLPVGTGLRALRPYFAAAWLMALVVWAEGAGLRQQGIAVAAVLAAQIATGIALYASYLYIGHRRELFHLLGQLRAR
jgi:O-antigen/teichoic acid export membrane protein